MIYGLFDRILLLSHSRFHLKNIIDMINILFSNGHPLTFIFLTIHTHIKFYINQSITLLCQDYFFLTFAKGANFKPAFTIPNKLNKFITTGKSSLEKMLSGRGL